jgi:proline dehydrogenase
MASNVSFENTQKAFLLKDDEALRHSLRLFRLLKHPLLVRIGAALTVFALKLRLPVKGLIRKTIFNQFCAGETLQETYPLVKQLSKKHVGSILDYSIEGKSEHEDFERTKNEVLRIMQLAAEDPAIPYTSLKLTGIARTALLQKLSEEQALNADEKKEYNELFTRLSHICREAELLNVPVYIDAEESWIQPEIDRLTEQMMWQHNHQRAIVNTTLQMYRHDRIHYLHRLLRKAEEENCFIGVKLVRGAYLEKENRRAAENNYPSPIHADKQSTDHDFDLAVDYCLKHIDRIALCAGTHNEASTMHLVKKMKALNIPNNHPHVYCSQLYGMSDHISFNLSDAGYNVTKYLPYGPIEAVLPYLIRRAEENSAIAGQMGRELTLLHAESERRKNQLLLNA